MLEGMLCARAEIAGREGRGPLGDDVRITMLPIEMVTLGALPELELSPDFGRPGVSDAKRWTTGDTIALPGAGLKARSTRFG